MAGKSVKKPKGEFKEGDKVAMEDKQIVEVEVAAPKPAPKKHPAPYRSTVNGHSVIVKETSRGFEVTPESYAGPTFRVPNMEAAYSNVPTLRDAEVLD
jgi:hypothetical protein